MKCQKIGRQIVFNIMQYFKPNTDDEPDEANPAEILSTSLLNVRKEALMAQRVGVREGLLQHVKRMKRDSDAKCPVLEIGATVRVPIPSLDRGKIDDWSVLAWVLRITEEDLYELDRKHGRLPQLYARSQFTVCVQNFVDEGDVPQYTIPLRSAAKRQAEETGGHGRGFVRCNCSKKCLTKSCSCRRHSLLCNSKCHGISSCSNK